ncbi:MAG: GNAT family N-acetyltransferase [Verrucomicrobia bacterium]|nr:GNAT family N-acetyltransferase [Verrucomicrobiota bacterium]
MTDTKQNQIEFPTITDISDQLYRIIAGGFDRTFRNFLQGKESVSRDGYFRFLSGLPHPIANLLILRDPNDAESLAEAVEPLCSDKFPSAVICLGAVGGKMDESLQSRGFEFTERQLAMAIDLPNLTGTTIDNDFTIRQVGVDDHEQWVDVFAEGYELPRAFADRVGPARAASITGTNAEYRYYIVFHHDRPVATALDIIRDGIVEVYNISTVPEYRGRGIGRWVTGEPLRIARDEGYKTAILQSSSQGVSVYRHLGFNSFGELPLYVRSPGC